MHFQIIFWKKFGLPPTHPPRKKKPQIFIWVVKSYDFLKLLVNNDNVL